MTEKKNSEKKGLRVLLLIVLAYALIVTGVVIYVKFDKEGYFKKDDIKNTEATVEEIGNIDLSEGLEDAVLLEANVMDEPTEIVQEDSATKKEEVVVPPPITPIEETEEDLNQDLEAVDFDYTIADVPARPKPESVSKSEDTEISDEEVLSATDLVLEVERPKSFFEKVVAYFSNLFSSDKEEEVEVQQPVSPESEQLVEELNSEIEELKSRFTFVSDKNGTTWIDHVDKSESNNQNGFYIYMGVNPQGFVYNRIVLQYSGKEWIGLNSILLQTDLSDRASIIDAKGAQQRKEFVDLKVKNEWVDLPPTVENNELLQIVSKANTVKLTFMGDQKNVEWIVSEQELSALKESIYFYELLKKKEKIK